MSGETSIDTSRETPTARRTTFRFVRPIALVVAGLITLALAGESSAARFGFGGMRSFGGMRAMHYRPMRPKMMRAPRMTGSRYTGHRRPDGYGSRTRYPGGTKLGSHDTGRWRYPHHPTWRNPYHPTWRYPRPIARPIIPFTPNPAFIPSPGVPPTINQAATPPGGGGGGQGPNQSGPNGPRLGFNPPPPGETRFVPNEVLLNLSADVTTPAFDVIARRNRLTRLELREFSMTGRRIARVRINDRRPVATVIRSLQGETGIAGAQPNYLFALNQRTGAAADPTQYAYSKLHLSKAHAFAKGESIRVAVIDSMIDGTHPDLAGAVAATYDATGSAKKPHFHGTGVAGVIAAHGKLVGAAPSVQILAATAFNPQDSRAKGSDILKALDWAGESKADVVNMSFAGPEDPEIHNELAAMRQKGIVLVAAAGNDGPKARPAYPGADPDVIAVTATDSEDNLYDHANQGSYIAVAAPGVSILVASPGGSYQMRTGTSFSAPLVSGVAALLLERNRKLDPDAIRALLTKTARHLGAPGQSSQFGAGLVDAFSAIESATMQSTDVSARGAPSN